MPARKQLATVIDEVLTCNEEVKAVENALVEEYKKLNNKCDVVIDKIKARKKNKKSKQAGE